MKSDKAQTGSGKTHFNKIKAKGQSWTELRDKSKKSGSWKSESNKE